MTTPTKLSKRTKGDGRAAFLTQLESIRAQLQAGYTLKTVYANHADALGFLYPQFGKYVRKLITGNPKTDEHQSKGTTPTVAPAPDAGPGRAVQPPVPIATPRPIKTGRVIPGEGQGARKTPFEYDPTKINPDELI